MERSNPSVARTLVAGFTASCAVLAIAQVAMTVPNDPKAAKPLPVGSEVPKVNLTNGANKSVSLKQVLNGKPTVLVFYRGGWCPFCTKQLADLGKNEQKLRDMGYQIIAISPDIPAELAKTTEKGELTYQVFSDGKADAMKAFGVAFRLDDTTFNLYKEKYGLDLEARSGEKHHILPVPTVFLINKEGKITFVHSDPDYTKRLSGEALLKAASN